MYVLVIICTDFVLPLRYIINKINQIHTKVCSSFFFFMSIIICVYRYVVLLYVHTYAVFGVTGYQSKLNDLESNSVRKYSWIVSTHCSLPTSCNSIESTLDSAYL